MKVDVIMGTYNREKMWPLVSAGLEANATYINRVILINDGPWEMYNGWKHTLPTIPIVYLNHQTHIGGGAIGLSLNIAHSRYVETEYAFHLADDIILKPNALKDFLDLAGPTNLVIGALRYLPKVNDINLEFSLDAQSELSTFHKVFEFLMLEGRPWRIGRNAFVLCSNSSYLEIGGHDPRYMYGYGCEEQDFDLRWQRKFGMGGFKITPGFPGYHIAPFDHSRVKLHPPNFFLLMEAAKSMYPKLNIMNAPIDDFDTDPDAINILNLKKIGEEIKFGYFSDFTLNIPYWRSELVKVFGEEPFKEIPNE